MIVIYTSRDSYSSKEASSHSMTVRELIDELSSYDEDDSVILSFDNNYTFGSIRSSRIVYEEGEDE